MNFQKILLYKRCIEHWPKTEINRANLGIRLFLIPILMFLFFQGGLSQSFCGFNDQYDPYIQGGNLNDFINEQIDDIQSMAKKLKNSSSSRMLDDIPIVVHIVHEGEAIGTGNNILYQDVVDAKDRLNADFASFGIQFCLALRDEEGNQLDEPGVVRVDASGNSEYVSNGVSVGGQTEYDIKALGPQFDSYLYFNIWVVKSLVGSNSNGQLLGVGTFPNTVEPERDGVMIRRSVFNLPTYRILTHEVGHYLGLFHTFQGDDADYDGVADQCPSATGNFPYSDGISDTQPHMRSTSLTCPSGPNTCPGGGLLEDISNNHMDYSSESCRTEFTAEQIAFMVATILDKREGLTLSLGCAIEVCDPVFAVDFTVSPKHPVAPDDQGQNGVPGIFTTTQSGTYQWYVDGTLVGGTATYSHDFMKPGIHTVCLHITDPNNCVIQNCKDILVLDAGLCSNPTLDPCELVLNGDLTQVNEGAIDLVGSGPAADYHFFPGTFNHIDVLCNWTNYIPEGDIPQNPAWRRFSNGEAFFVTHFFYENQFNPFSHKEGFGTLEELELVDGVDYELSFEYLLDDSFDNFYFALSSQMGMMENSATKIFNSGPIDLDQFGSPTENDEFIKSGSIPFTYSASDGKYLYFSADLEDGNPNIGSIYVKNISVKACDVCAAAPFFTYENVCGDFTFTGVNTNMSSNGGIVSWRINGVTVPHSFDMNEFDFNFPFEGDFEVCMDITCANGATASYCDIVFAGGTYTVGNDPTEIPCEMCEDPQTINVTAQRCGTHSNEFLVESFPITVPKGYRPCLGDFELTEGLGGTIQTNDYYIDESDSAEDVIYVSFTFHADGSSPVLSGEFAVCSPDGSEIACFRFVIDNMQSCKCADSQPAHNLEVMCIDNNITDGVIDYSGSFTISTSQFSYPCGDISPNAGLNVQSVTSTSVFNDIWDVEFTISTNQLGSFNTSVTLCFYDMFGSKICFDVIISVTDPCIPEEGCEEEILLGRLTCDRVEGDNAIYSFGALVFLQDLFEAGYVFCDENPVTGDHVTDDSPIGPSGNPILATEGSNSYIFGAEITISCDDVKNVGMTTIYLNLCNPDGREACVAVSILLDCPDCGTEKNEDRANIASIDHVIYPNPAKDAIRVKSPESKNSQQYTIYTSASRVMDVGNLTSGITEINTDHFPSGIYYMKIEDGDKVTMKKFIVID